MAPSNVALSIDLGLAYTNRDFNAIVLNYLYSRNSFIFHLSNAEVGVEIKSNNFHAWHSYSRKFGCRHTSNPQSFAEDPAFGPLGQLTSRTAKYLRSVMLVVSTPWRSVEKQGVHHLTPIVAKAIDILLGSGNVGNAARLEELDVCFIAEPVFGGMPWYHIIKGLHVNFDEKKAKMVAEFKPEPLLHAPFLRPQGPPCQTKLLAPAKQLFRLCRVGRVSVSGDIKEGFTTLLQQTITRNENGEAREIRQSQRTKRGRLN
ncbi:hypothetical protein B0T26DRAFT_730765 [Lasiosphaeria miniovina]|uniref:Uncharacterized protein n=1 Tax=Lasiosphaeria miniovina TaxID=1954250 RepID=A0AA39ZTH3_9PEZI|nr:uncharacterized protein B0T26DRAFT_730765 [Lasiosphaeria miniovina]KAK0703302.1 hypothetical protein B0T26DRAFT_730765 [Lasiosphaeria miniovina]